MRITPKHFVKLHLRFQDVLFYQVKCYVIVSAHPKTLRKVACSEFESAILLSKVLCNYFDTPQNTS